MTPALLTPKEFSAITDLAAQLDSAKLVESVAKADRIVIEAKLAALIPGPEEGQRTITLADKSKVVVERGLIYNADLDAMGRLVMGDLPLPIESIPVESRTTRKLDIAGYRWYRENHPDIFAELAKCVVVKAKKIAVTIKPPKK